MIQRKVLEAFEKEIVLAHKPGYRCSYDDYGEDRIAGLKHPQETAAPDAAPETPAAAAPTIDGKTIRIDGPDGSHRRIEPASPTSHAHTTWTPQIGLRPSLPTVNPRLTMASVRGLFSRLIRRSIRACTL